MAKFIYIEIKEYLLRLIKENRSTPGYMLPSENQLAVKFATTRITAKRALNELQQEGYILRKHGKGSFINQAATEGALSQTGEFICLMLPNIDSIFISRIVKGVRETCLQFGYTPLIVNEPNLQSDLIAEIMKRDIKGIIVFPNSKTNYNKDLLALSFKNFPMIFIDRYMSGLEVSSVSSNHEEAGRLAVRILSERGCKNIGFITSPAPYTSSAQERIFGYERQHIENQMLIRNDYILEVSKQDEDIDEKLVRYFQKHPEIDGLLSYGDIIGIHVYKALRECKIRVPQQMKVIFLDDEYANYSDILPFSPSCIIQQSREIGRQAASLLIKYMKGQIKHDEKIQLDYQFIERESTKTEGEMV